MIKSELVQRIAAQNPHLYQRDVENIVNAILGEITSAMAQGRPRRVARLRRLLGQAPAGPHRPQSAHRRACLGRAEIGAVLQDRQGNARAAEQDRRRCRRRSASMRRVVALSSWPGLPRPSMLCCGAACDNALHVPQNRHRDHCRSAGRDHRRLRGGQPAGGDGVVRSVLVGEPGLCGDAAAVRR